MTPLARLTAPAVALDRANVDTDQIIPARFLRKPRSAGYQNFLFHDLRGADADFPLDAPHAKGAAILVARANFGGGSSREGAVYALVDAGFRCVIAPSFGDIFAGNAAKNGLLTVVLPEGDVDLLVRALAHGGTMSVDLAAQLLTFPEGNTREFSIDSFRKRCLVEGLDDIGLTQEHTERIAAWEARDKIARSWALPPA
jgi:3-isopropylmalate/(R)-2-methylmalate dehydratase small subunit